MPAICSKSVSGIDRCRRASELKPNGDLARRGVPRAGGIVPLGGVDLPHGRPLPRLLPRPGTPALLRAASAWRYHTRCYRWPLELGALQRVVAYQRPETSGF